jgi:VWFA-related protein
MIRRCLFAVLWSTVAVAQLPPPQALPPRIEANSKLTRTRKGASHPITTPWRVDAVATGPDGRAVADLTAADFEVLTDGKPQKVTAAEFHAPGPLCITLVVDDLSLSPENVPAVKTALQGFVKRLQPGDEAAILRTSVVDGWQDRFTSEPAALEAAIGQLRSNRPPGDSPQVFTTGSLSALRSALLGLQFLPGRKLVVFLSERLWEPERANQPTWMDRLLTAANRSSTVVYGVNIASSAKPSYMLSQGLAGLAPQTGGAFYDAAGDTPAALARILDSQQGYYILHFDTDQLQHMAPLTATAGRPGVQVHVRDGVLGLAGDNEGLGFLAPENGLRAAIGTPLLGTGMHLSLTPVPGNAAEPYLEGALHIDARDVTLTLAPDGQYHGEVEALIALFQESDGALSQAARGMLLNITPEQRQQLLESGINVELRLPTPKKGPYQMRASVQDQTSGRLGAAARFFEFTESPLPPLTMAPIQMDTAGDPPRHIYPAGQVLQYSYELGNLRLDPQSHAKVEVTSRIVSNGKVIYAGAPQTLDFALAPRQTKARISGTVKLGGQNPTGKFTLTVTALDTLATGAARRGATQTIEFEVQP